MSHKKGKHLLKGGLVILLNNKLITIILAYCFTGINLIVSGLLNRNDYYLIGIGIIMLMMIPITIFDKREEMRGTLYTVFMIVLHFIFCFAISLILSSYWWLCIYIKETVLGVCFILVSERLKKK